MTMILKEMGKVNIMYSALKTERHDNSKMGIHGIPIFFTLKTKNIRLSSVKNLKPCYGL